MKTKPLTEHQEQAKLFAWLKTRGITAFAVPNGASLKSAHMGWNRLKREGCSPGAPDVHIVTPPPKSPNKRVYIELKKACLRNRKAGELRPHQIGWKHVIEKLGQIHILAYGADDAIDQLYRLGF